jgi:septum formation protein
MFPENWPHSVNGAAMPLILASTSAARRAMFAAAGIQAQAVPSGVDETALKTGFTGSAPALAQTLAQAKAAAVAGTHPEALVIGADQLLVCDGKIFDKPTNLAEAADHLRLLSGRVHELITAVCVMQGGTLLWAHTESARLTVRQLSEAFIARYLAAEGTDILNCVGAYRLEGWGAQLFERIEGDYFTILGLPLLPLLGFLRDSGALLP